MQDDAFITSRLKENGISADADTIQLVKTIAVHGQTGMKDREILALTADITNLAAKLAKDFKKTGPALAAVGAVLDIVTSIFKLVSDLKDREETNEIAKQHLQGLDTAIGLAPESIRIVTAVKQIVDRGFDEHELRSSDAERNVTVDLLAYKIQPLAQRLDEMSKETVSDYHKRLIARMDIHRKNTHMDLQRFSQGVVNMNGDYSINTNHLVHYSDACVLDAFLGYYELLLSQRLGDDLLHHNLETYARRNKDAIRPIEQALERYTNGRVEKIRTKAYYDAGQCYHKDCVWDEGSPNDQILGRIDINPIATSGSIDWNGCGMFRDGDGVQFWCSVWDNRTHPPAQSTKRATQQHIRDSLAPKTGAVWKRLVERPTDLMRYLEERIRAILALHARQTMKANLQAMEDGVKVCLSEKSKQNGAGRGRVASWFY